jgi:peroxiredoxin Q/BCP
MELKVGDKIPNFKTYDTNGDEFNSSSIIGRKPIVIYFYPKDNTPGCTAQVCSFRDQYEDFKDLGAEVIGVSSDSTASHQKFTKQYQLPFILLSDQDKNIRKLFGVPSGFWGLLPGRVTYVINKDGVLVSIFNSSMMPKKHILKALEVLKSDF